MQQPARPPLSAETRALLAANWERRKEVMRRIHEFHENDAPTEKKATPPHLLEAFK